MRNKLFEKGRKKGCQRNLISQKPKKVHEDEEFGGKRKKAPTA